MAGVVMGKMFFMSWTSAIAALFNAGIHAKGNSLDREATETNEPAGAAAETEKRILDPSFFQKQSDFITHLPGLGYDPGFNQYSGYLNVDEDHGRRIFYWYVESQSSPEHDPLVLWTNGGPGCSGLLGFGAEHGPFLFTKDGLLSPNPFSWNKVANMLYIEQPSGVGYSYSDTLDDYVTNDANAAADNYALIGKFLERFPERRANDFYISSESYGGHYMPQLTKVILENNEDGMINFKGMLVGNPFVDWFTNDLSRIETFYTHGLLSWPHYKKWIHHCHSEKKFFSKKCAKYEEVLWQEMGNGINPYAVDYPICVEQPSVLQSSPMASATLGMDGSMTTVAMKHSTSMISAQSNNMFRHSVRAKSRQLSGEANPPWLPPQDVYHACAEEYTVLYLNRPDVMEALHVKAGGEIKWKPCSDNVEYDFDSFAESQIDLYEDLMEMLEEHPIDIMVFSGDDDAICSTAGTQKWIWDIGVDPKPSKMWQPWIVQNQTAGYVTVFDVDGPGSFTFVTVHGAGHEVPWYRPMEALEMLQRYLKGAW